MNEIEEWKLYKSLLRSNIFISSFGRVKSINLKTGIEKYLSLYRRGGKRRQYLGFGYKEEGKKILICVHHAVGSCFFTL